MFLKFISLKKQKEFTLYTFELNIKIITANKSLKYFIEKK